MTISPRLLELRLFAKLSILYVDNLTLKDRPLKKTTKVPW